MHLSDFGAADVFPFLSSPEVGVAALAGMQQGVR